MSRIALKDIMYVSVQLLLFLLYLFPIVDLRFALSNWLLSLALIVSVSGLLILVLAMLQLNSNLTPFPTPKAQGSLVQSGLYKYSRHPVYAGIILFTVFFGVYSQSTWRIGIGFLLWVLFYFKSVYEEKLLEGRYKAYAAYREKTGRFFYFD